MIKRKFKQTTADRCIYVDSAQERYFAVYVDNGIIISKTENDCIQLISALNFEFKTDRSVFLGLEIQQHETEIITTQQSYISDITKQFGMENCSSVSSPIIDTAGLTCDDDSETVEVPYRHAIGSLLYCALCTRPHILFATIFLSRFNAAPKQKHWTAVRRIIRYLCAIADYGLEFKNCSNKLKIYAYSDADRANDRSTRQSLSGILLQINESPIIFKSHRQSTIKLSTCEAEFLAAQ